MLPFLVKSPIPLAIIFLHYWALMVVMLSDQWLCHPKIIPWYREVTAAHFKAGYLPYTVWCHDNMVNFLPHFPNRHPIAHPQGRDMGYLLWVQSLIYVLPLSWQCSVCYRDKLDRVITALDCISSTVTHKLTWDFTLKFTQPINYSATLGQMDIKGNLSHDE